MAIPDSALVKHLKSQVAAADKAMMAAERGWRQEIVRADRAEIAERQITADRDRWKRLALAYESELRSLVPHYHHAELPRGDSAHDAAAQSRA